MAIITRFGGSGGGTPIVDPYPHVWECTVVQSGTTGVVSGVVTLEAYDILHYTMPLGFSTYDLMIGGVTYHTSFRNEGEMYVQWTGTDFVVVSANAACALSHVWTSPTYTITGTVLEITAGVDELHTNDVIVLTLASGESASNIEYNSQVYTIDLAISEGTNYVQFNGTSFDNALFNFKGNATASDVASGKTFYSSDGTLRTGSASSGVLGLINSLANYTGNVSLVGTNTLHITQTVAATFASDSIYLVTLNSVLLAGIQNPFHIENVTKSGNVVEFDIIGPSSSSYSTNWEITCIKFKNSPTITRYFNNSQTQSRTPYLYVTTIGIFKNVERSIYWYSPSDRKLVITAAICYSGTMTMLMNDSPMLSTYVENAVVRHVGSSIPSGYQEYTIEW